MKHVDKTRKTNSDQFYLWRSYNGLVKVVNLTLKESDDFKSHLTKGSRLDHIVVSMLLSNDLVITADFPEGTGNRNITKYLIAKDWKSKLNPPLWKRLSWFYPIIVTALLSVITVIIEKFVIDPIKITEPIQVQIIQPAVPIIKAK